MPAKNSLEAGARRYFVGSSANTETLVVGAGPAGIATAITLQAAGRDVTVVDKATFPRDKTCGDGLTAGCLRQLDALGFDPGTVPSWHPVGDIYLHTPAQEPLHYALPEGKGQFAASATRLDLDLALVELAVDRGVEILTGEAVETVQLHDQDVSVQTTSTNFRAQWVVAADGMWSTVRRQLGLGSVGYRGDWHAFRQYFSNVAEAAASELHVWFEPDILPGYVWSFPLADGQANIGFGVWRHDFPVNQMGSVWKDVLNRPHIRAVLGDDATPLGAPRAWPIPARIGDLPLTAHRTFFVGDAAAACDPMTGEGIGQALETGREAAQAILSVTPGADSPHRVTGRYEDQIARGLARDMRLAAQLGAVLGHKHWAQRALRTTALTPWTRRNFVRWLFEDYPRAILTTPHRWTRDTFTRSGAFVPPS